MVENHDSDSAQSPAYNAFKSNLESEYTDSEAYANYYIVVVDTGNNYYMLQQGMLELHAQLHLSVDTMNRFYDTNMNQIILSPDDEAEMYAGTYFPRRFPSEHLSLEYMQVYHKASKPETIALIYAICETEHQALKAMAKVSHRVQHAFIFQSNVYVGCLH